MKKPFCLSIICFVVLLIIGCEKGKNKTHPFDALSANMVGYVQSVINDSQLKNDESHFKKFFDKQKELCNELKGKTILVEIDEGLGLELVSPEGKIGKATGESTISIPVNIDLKVTDANTAYDIINDLMVLACDEKDEAVYIGYLGAEKDLENGFLDNDTIEEISDDIIVERKNPYKEGDVLHKGVDIIIEPFIAQQFVNVSKLVIKKYDSAQKAEIEEKNKAIEDEIKARLNGEAPLSESSQENAKAEEFLLDKGKLGPIEIGKNINDLPKSVEGLYDKSDYKKEVHESDMEDDWTEEYYVFSKDGKDIFRTDVEGGKVISIALLAGASFIKTSDGFCIGSSAQELFKAKKMQWENYYEGDVFASSGHYTYFVNSDDLVNTDIPRKASDFKSIAKINRIIYK